MTDYMVILPLGDPSPMYTIVGSQLHSWNTDGGEDGETSWSSFLPGPTHPFMPHSGKNSLCVSRRIMGLQPRGREKERREREHWNESLENQILSPALPPNKLGSLRQDVHLSGSSGGSERAQPDEGL